MHRLPSIPAGGDHTGTLLRDFDWSATPLGEAVSWPEPLRTLVQLMLGSNQPMFVVWGPRRTLIYNHGYSHILGAKHPAAIGRDFLEVWEEIRADLTPLVDQAYGGTPVQMDDVELLMHRKGYPEETHFSFFYAPIRLDNGGVAGFFCACNETTVQVLAQRELRASEARHRGVLANMGEAFVLLDRELRVVEVNAEALRLDGRPRATLVGQALWDLYPDAATSPFAALLRTALSHQRAGQRDGWLVWPGGRRLWMEVRVYPTADGLALFCRDVTARRRTEKAAAEAAERVQLALDAGAIIGTWVWEVAADRMIGDERFERTFGLDPQAGRKGLSLHQVMESIHPHDQPRVGEAIEAAMRRGGAYRCQYRVRQHDGVFRWIEANGRVELDAAGVPQRFPGVLLDIEERRRAEAERDDAYTLLRTFIEAVPGVVYAKDRQGRMLLANRGTAELIGKPPEAFLGKTDAEFLADQAQAARVMATDQRIMEHGHLEQVEEDVTRADGSPAVWLSTKTPLRDAQGQVIGLIGTSLDITERRLEQEKARTEAEMLDLLNQTSAILSAELELDVLLQRVTDAATRLTNAQFGAFFYNGVDQQGEAYLLYTLSGAPREAFEGFGHPRPTPVFEPTFRGGPPIRVDDITRDPRYGQWGPHHGKPKGHLPVCSYLAVPVLSRRGDVIGGLFFGHPEPAVFTERSERLAVGIAAQAAVAIDNARLYAEAQRAAEERKRLLESERAARAEAERASTLKDQFLATLSHELRTPLSSILGWTHILRRKLDPHDPVLKKGLDLIERSTHLQTQLIEDLLDMSRITSGKLALSPEPVTPLGFVQAAVDVLAPTAAAARVRVSIAADEPGEPVLGDPARLQQVVWNLIANAIKFSEPGSEVQVRVGGDAQEAVIAVRDQGAGIAPEFLPHVFDRFSQADGTTTRRFGGLGLGLAIVRHLVELHGGSVQAHSEGPGRGACFEVRLPRIAQGEPGLAPQSRTLRLAPGETDLAGRRILVVDDEPDVRDLLMRVLTDAGAQVVGAGHAHAAMAAFEQNAFPLVISDIGMPDVDGYELARRLRHRAAREGSPLRMIGLSAFARPEDRRRALDSGFDVYLTKPVTIQELLACVGAMKPEASA